MVISKDIRILKNDCDCGDIVQFENMVCMVIRTDSDVENWSTGFGLLCLEGFDAGKIVADNLGLIEIDKRIASVLVPSSEVYIGIQKEGVE